MNETDWQMLAARRSCALLTRDQMEEGKVPTVSTTGSVIAGIQCQEAVKLLHGLDVIDGRGFVFEGMQHTSYVVAYTRKDDCPAHDADEPVQCLDWSVCRTPRAICWSASAAISAWRPWWRLAAISWLLSDCASATKRSPITPRSAR